MFATYIWFRSTCVVYNCHVGIRRLSFEIIPPNICSKIVPRFRNCNLDIPHQCIYDRTIFCFFAKHLRYENMLYICFQNFLEKKTIWIS